MRRRPGLQRKQLIEQALVEQGVVPSDGEVVGQGLRRPADAPAALQRKQLIEQALVGAGVMPSDGEVVGGACGARLMRRRPGCIGSN